MELDRTSVSALVRDLGFQLRWDIPTGRHGALLAIAIRDEPTERHFDPELIRYWRTDPTGRGRIAEVTIATPMPRVQDFAWGPIEIQDRFGIANAFVSFGGSLEAWSPDPRTTIAAFRSPGPILRRGGHSQAYDRFAAELLAFFARMMVPIDFTPGAERAISMTAPIVRYAAFLHHERVRLRANEAVRAAYGEDARIVWSEANRLSRTDPDAWLAGAALLRTLGLVREPVRTASRTSATG
jgi:hypothetical protein